MTPPSGHPTELFKVAAAYASSADAAQTSSNVAASALPGVQWIGSAKNGYVIEHGDLTSKLSVAVDLLSKAALAVKTYAQDLQEAINLTKTANHLIDVSNKAYYKWQSAIAGLDTAEGQLYTESSTELGDYNNLENWYTQNTVSFSPHLMPKLGVHIAVPQILPAFGPPSNLVTEYDGAINAVAKDNGTVNKDQTNVTNAAGAWSTAYQAAKQAITNAQNADTKAQSKAKAAFQEVTAAKNSASWAVPTATVAAAPGTGSGTTVIGGGNPGGTHKGSGGIVKELLALTSVSALRKAVEQDLASHKLTGTDLFALLMALPVSRATLLLTDLPATSSAWTDISDFTPAQLSQLTARFAGQGQGKSNDLAEVLAKVPPTDLTKVLASLSTLPPDQVAKVFTPDVLSGLSQDHVSAVLTNLPAKDLTPVLTALPASELGKVVSPALLKALPVTGLSHLLSALPGKDITSVFSAVPTAGLTAKSEFIENIAHALDQMTITKASQILPDLPAAIGKLVAADLPKSF
jgi:hypothetical protein